MKSSSSPIQKTAQPSRQSMKIRIMNNSIEIKVLIKFGASDVRFVELTAKKLPKMYTMDNMWKLSPSSPIQKTTQPSRQSTKLRNMIISMKTKVLIKFGASNARCVELRAKKLSKVYTIENM